METSRLFIRQLEVFVRALDVSAALSASWACSCILLAPYAAFLVRGGELGIHDTDGALLHVSLHSR